MTACETIEKRLREIAADRSENVEKCHELIAKWTDERDKALARMNDTKKDPAKLRDLAVAKVQVDEANAQIAELQKMLKAYKYTPVMGSPEETEELFTKMKREQLVDMIERADRALELQKELFDITLEMARIAKQNYSLRARWMQEACDRVDLLGEPKYNITPPEIIKKVSGYDASYAMITGTDMYLDGRAAALKNDITRMWDELRAL